MKPAQFSKKLKFIASDIISDPNRQKVTDRLDGLVLALSDKTSKNIPSREGLFAVSDYEVISHLQKWLTAKYTIDAAYRSYADRVKGPWRDALVDHWYDHAEEERKQAYDLAMKIVGLGGDPMQTTINVPPALPNFKAFCISLMELELKAIENGYIAIQMSGENTPLRVLSEQIMYVDSHHLDDLKRMCTSFDILV